MMCPKPPSCSFSQALRRRTASSETWCRKVMGGGRGRALQGMSKKWVLPFPTQLGQLTLALILVEFGKFREKLEMAAVRHNRLKQ